MNVNEAYYRLLHNFLLQSYHRWQAWSLFLENFNGYSLLNNDQ